MSNTPALGTISLDDAVRLLYCRGDVPSGSVGRVLGMIPRPIDTTYVVSFVDEKLRVLELHANEIVPVRDFHAAA